MPCPLRGWFWHLHAEQSTKWRALPRKIRAVSSRGVLMRIAVLAVGTMRAECYLLDMRKSDVTCPACKAGYRRIEVNSGKPTTGEYRCLLCDHVLEVFDGSTEVAIRLTVQPEKILE
jgi:transposase-like protein